MGCALSRLKTKASTTYLKPQKIVRTHQECKADDLTGNPTNFPAEKAWWCCQSMEARQERRHRCQTVSLLVYLAHGCQGVSTVQQQKSKKKCQYQQFVEQLHNKAVRPFFCFALPAAVLPNGWTQWLPQWFSSGFPVEDAASSGYSCCFVFIRSAIVHINHET